MVSESESQTEIQFPSNRGRRSSDDTDWPIYFISQFPRAIWDLKNVIVSGILAFSKARVQITHRFRLCPASAISHFSGTLTLIDHGGEIMMNPGCVELQMHAEIEVGMERELLIDGYWNVDASNRADEVTERFRLVVAPWPKPLVSLGQ
jgi:hypothetical protein